MVVSSAFTHRPLRINRLVSYSLSFDEIRALAKRTQSLKSHQLLTHVRYASQAARRLAGITDVCQQGGGAGEPVCGLRQRVSEDDRTDIAPQAL